MSNQKILGVIAKCALTRVDTLPQLDFQLFERYGMWYKLLFDEDIPNDVLKEIMGWIWMFEVDKAVITVRDSLLMGVNAQWSIILKDSDEYMQQSRQDILPYFQIYKFSKMRSGGSVIMKMIDPMTGHTTNINCMKCVGGMLLAYVFNIKFNDGCNRRDMEFENMDLDFLDEKTWTLNEMIELSPYNPSKIIGLSTKYYNISQNHPNPSNFCAYS